MIVNKRLLLIAAILILKGCATFHASIPEGYTGPTASIEDTAKKHDAGKADFFYLSHIDGKEIEHSRIQSIMASYGNGDYLNVVILNNRVPAQQHIFTIVGRTHYAMPIRALAGTVYQVKGDVSFSPIPNEQYVIRGSLAEEHAVVWIERTSNGEVIDKIEVEGPSKLGFFEK